MGYETDEFCTQFNVTIIEGSMKKSLLIIGVFCSLFSLQLQAQDCKMCGDWTGTVWKKYPHNTKSDDDGDWRMGKMTQFIRINQFGNEYKIRLKHRFEEGDIGTVYEDDEIVILNSTDTSLYFQTTSGLSCDYDQYGRITECDRLQMFFLITYHNGYIHYE